MFYILNFIIKLIHEYIKNNKFVIKFTEDENSLKYYQLLGMKEFYELIHRYIFLSKIKGLIICLKIYKKKKYFYFF